MCCIQLPSDRHLPCECCPSAAMTGMEKTAVEDIIVPSVFFSGITVVFALFFWFRYRMRHDMQKTIRSAIDKGQELSPEIIDHMGSPKPAPNRDLRIGMIWLGLAAGCVGFALAFRSIEQEVTSIFMGIAAFPLALGVAFLLIWRFAGDKS